MMDRSKQWALVTGGSRGIGLGIAENLATAGYNLVISGRKPAEDIHATIESLKTKNIEVLYFQGDLAMAENRNKLLQLIETKQLVLSQLINNAGIAPPVRLDILETTENNYDAVLNTNLKANFFLSQSIAKYMINNKIEGNIVNITSVSATMASTNRAEYCIAKAGLAMSSQAFALRLAEYGIGVFEIRPGIIATDMTATVTEKYNTLINNGLVPQGRWGKPNDIAKVVTQICQNQLAFSTGSIIHVDGGLHLGRL